MGHRLSRGEKEEEGGECVNGVSPSSSLTSTEHMAMLQPHPDETRRLWGVSEGGVAYCSFSQLPWA